MSWIRVWEYPLRSLTLFVVFNLLKNSMQKRFQFIFPKDQLIISEVPKRSVTISCGPRRFDRQWVSDARSGLAGEIITSTSVDPLTFRKLRSSGSCETIEIRGRGWIILSHSERQSFNFGIGSSRRLLWCVSLDEPLDLKLKTIQEQTVRPIQTLGARQVMTHFKNSNLKHFLSF